MYLQPRRIIFLLSLLNAACELFEQPTCSKVTLANCSLLLGSDNTHIVGRVLDVVPKFNFSSSSWTEEHLHDWNYFVMQDLFYLDQYDSLIEHMSEVCRDLPTQALQRLETSLRFDFNLSEAASRYSVSHLLKSRPSRVLKEYLDHYFAQHQCLDLLSAMLPCLCLYPTLFSAIQHNTLQNQHTLPQGVRAMINDSASGGHLCAIVRSVLEDRCMAAAFEASLHFEVSFTNLVVGIDVH